MILTACILILSALLESGGDALVRGGLQGRSWMLAVGGGSLFLYGIVVNQSRIDFGRLMGAYIVVFFIVSQVIAALFFHQLPRSRTIVGGALLMAGGVAILY